MYRAKRKSNSDAHYCVLADLLFSVMIALVTMINERVSVTEMCVVQDQISDTATTTESTDDNSRVFTMLADGQIRLGQEIVNAEGVTSTIKNLQASSNNRLLLRVSPECPHQHVAKFYKVCADHSVRVTEQVLIESKKEELR